MDPFEKMWRRMAKLGWCDAEGSAEYDRVKALWFNMGWELAIVEFIFRNANQPPIFVDAQSVVKETKP